MDTSESIWAVLEAEKNNQKTLEASTLSESVDSAGASSSQQARILSHGARLAARAFVLWQTQGQEVSRKFPLLAKQRVQLVDLCRKLRAACLCRLESGHLDRALTVDALAALALLDVVQSSQKDQFWQEDSIKSGLSLCSLWLKQRLGAISKSSTSWEKLSAVGEIVKDVVCEVESLFVASKHHAKVNLATLCLPDVEGDIWYKALPENDKELEKVLRKRKAIIAEIKSTSVTLKRRRKELVSGMGEIVSLFKSQAGNIVQQAAALQGKKEQRMRDTRRKSVQQALGVLANHL